MDSRSQEETKREEETQQALREVRDSLVDDLDLDQVVLRIKTSDGDVFKLDPRVTQASKFLRAKLNDVGREDEIEFESISTLILLKSIAYMQHHNDDHPLPRIEMPITSANLAECGLTKWHHKFMNLDSDMLLQLLGAADILIIKSLHQLIIAKFAARLYESARVAASNPRMVSLPLTTLFLLLSEGIPYLQARERSNAMYVLAEKVTPDLDAESRSEAVRLVGKRFGDSEESVRATALEVLPRVSVQGNDDSFYAVAEWLEHRDSGIRCFAIKAFGIVADRGAERSIARVTACLRSNNPDARREAIPILFDVCDDAAQAIQIMGETLEHDEERICNYAAEILLEQAKAHHATVFDVVHARLQHWNAHVRSVAIETLSHLCKVGDEQVNAMVRGMLMDPVAKVRRVAVEVLGRIARKDDPEILAACRILFEHEDDGFFGAEASEGIRQTAKELFLTCAEPGSEAQYALVLPLMYHENEAVRNVAGDALRGTLDEKRLGDAANLACCVEHQIRKICEAVTEALARVAEKNTDQGIGADAVDRPRVEDPGIGLFAEASHTFALIPEPGSRHALAMLTERVEYNEESTREAMIVALVEFHEHGHERLLRAAGILMEDQIMRVLERMTQVFNVLAEGSVDRLFEAVFHGLEHHDPRIRRAAAQKAVSMFQMLGQKDCIDNLLSLVKRQIIKVRDAMVDALADQLTKGSKRVVGLVTERLENEATDVRMAAIRNMSRIVSCKDDDFAVSEVCRRLENPSIEVRSDAVKALLEITTVGCESSVKAVMSRLEHEDAAVRKTATEAVPQIAGIDNESTISDVCALLDHVRPSVRETALECLGLLVTKGNQHAIKTAAAFLEHEEEMVRDLAIIALTKVSNIDDVCAATEVLQRLEVKEEYVVITALKALPYVLSKDDETAVAWVVECLGDVHEDVRLGAHAVLTQVASRGNLAAVTGIGRNFGHKSTRVRKLAGVAIFDVADVGSEAAISSVCVHLSHGDADVRNLIVTNLEKIAGKGNPYAFQEVVIHLENKDKRVLVSALEAMVEVSVFGDPNAVAAAGGFLSHVSPEVRKAAGDAFELLTPKFSEQALELLKPLFNKKNVKIVISALDALGRVAGRGNQAAWDIANRFLSPPHDKPGARKAAVIAMGRICEICNDERTEQVLVSRLGDLDPEVKETAAEWLDIYRGKKPPPRTMGRKPTLRGAAAGVIASRRMSSGLLRQG